MNKRVSTFALLAQMYFPGCSTNKNAVRCLNRWISRCQNLASELLTTGYQPYNHRYLTPKQYTIIVQYLGDPWIE
nr:DUF4248 domain-containing protein [uncultured Bacteroides sp.]